MKNKNKDRQLFYEKLSKRIYFKDGKPYWNDSYYHTKKGLLAGCINKSTGYRFISCTINNKEKLISSHRLNWFINHGYLPSNCIDHIDRDKTNDEIENLREATASENGMNRDSAKNSSSKYLGVCWHKRDKKWQASIKINGKSKHIGCFIREGDAAKAYNENAVDIFGEFANLNIIEKCGTCDDCIKAKKINGSIPYKEKYKLR